MNPTNLSLLNPNKIMWGLMQAVTSPDVHEGITNNLHDEGLYSTEIFGRVGTDQRDQTESFIDVKIPVFNPTYFKSLVQLKALYGGIIRGVEYALWDETEKDFIRSNVLEGETGYGFFMSHFFDLEPKLNDSNRRKKRVELITRFRDIALTSKIIVIPAGIRDVQIEPDGQVVEQEINDLYRRLLFRGRSIVIRPGDENNSMYDSVRWGIQSGFNDIDNYIFNLMEGKTGFLRRRIGTRGIAGGTRNVITARRVSVSNADELNSINVNSTDIGVYQGLLAFQYVSGYALLNGFLSRAFTEGSTTAKLVNMKTFEYEYVDVDASTVERWTSSDGLTKLFNGFKNRQRRNRPIIINGRYLGLIYDDGKNVRILGDINELPEGFDKQYVTPLTYMELFYTECVLEIEKRLLQVTRYPITGVGSIYPSEINLRSTTGSQPRILLDDFWEEKGRLNNFPVKEEKPSYFDAMSVDPSREAGLGSDHDGDQLNANGINSDDAIAEAKALMGRREFYISGAGKFLYSPIVEPHEFLFRSLTNGLTD